MPLQNGRLYRHYGELVWLHAHNESMAVVSKLDRDGRVREARGNARVSELEEVAQVRRRFIMITVPGEAHVFEEIK